MAEVIELYFVKLQFMVVIKIIHFVSFQQISIFLSILYTISLHLPLYLLSFIFFFSTTFSSFVFLLNFNIFYILFSLLGLLRSIYFTCFMYIAYYYFHTYYHYYLYYFYFILFIIFISYCFYFLAYSFCKQLEYYLQPAEMLLTVSSTAPK